MSTVFKEQARWLIHSIEFQALPYETDSESVNINITPIDSIQVYKRNLSEATFIIKRTLKIEPIEVFSLSIELEVAIGFDENATTSEMKDSDLVNAFKEHCAGVISIIMSRTSLLISEITGGSGQTPIITEPHFVENNPAK